MAAVEGLAGIGRRMRGVFLPALTIGRGIATFGFIMSILGIHHVTALASDPQRNVDFYAGFLGLRLVKRTVNFDAPDVYHLYYGDQTGRPGTILTFFPFPDAARGKRGAGEISSVAFSVPAGSLEYWAERVAENGAPLLKSPTRFSESILSFTDPDGMTVELVEDSTTEGTDGWPGSPVGERHAIRKLHGVTILHGSLAPTASLLTDTLAFASGGSEGNRHRFLAGTGYGASRIDVVVDPRAPMAHQSAGSVHHIAWRVADDAEQLSWRPKLREAGAAPTPVMDRQYFHSIYFREPGGVLFEIATDPPGFLIDEPVDELGSQLKLPPWLQQDQSLLEQRLPPLALPSSPIPRPPIADGLQGTQRAP